jgi:hypothetical protein
MLLHQQLLSIKHLAVLAEWVINMAADELNLSQQSTLPPELFAQQQALNRQQQMAAMLMQQNQQPQGQMISGHYVAPSFFQNLQPVANMLTGAYLAKQGDTQAAKLAEQLRTGREAERQAVIDKIKQNDVTGALALPNVYGGATPFQNKLIERSLPELPTSAQELEYSKTHPELIPFIHGKAMAGSTKIMMPPVENAYNQAFGKGVAEQDLALKSIAEGAKTTVGNIARQKQILDSGNFFSGKAANLQTDLANYGTALGITGATGQEKAANTQSLIGGAAGITLDSIKGSGLGSGQGFTNKDLDFLNDAKSFKVTWNKENIARVLDLQERAAIEGAKKWNSRQGQIQKSATGPINVGPVDVPSPYSGQVKLISIESK